MPKMAGAIALALMISGLALATGCGATSGNGEHASPHSTATTLPQTSPSSTVSAVDLAAAKAVVRRLISAVNDDRFALARSLMVAPDRSWSLDDMKAIRFVRLRRVKLRRVETADAVLLATDLRREPPPRAGGPYWPNFMLVVRDGSGRWRVARTMTGE